MSWVNELIDLYEKNSDKIGVIEYIGEIPYVLLPPFHTTVTAHITVTNEEKENFINLFYYTIAKTLDKEYSIENDVMIVIVVPAWE